MTRTLWNRREALQTAVRGLAFVAAGGLVGCESGGRDALEPAVATIVDEVRRALPELTLDAAGVVAFARELVAHREAGRLRPLPGLDLRSRFLLSSDLFRRGDEALDRPVRYAAFYDPYVTPCANPLPRRSRGGERT